MDWLACLHVAELQIESFARAAKALSRGFRVIILSLGIKSGGLRQVGTVLVEL